MTGHMAAGPTSNLGLHNRISAPLDDPHVGGLSRLHLNPCVPFFSHLMRISKAHVDPPAGDVMFSTMSKVVLHLRMEGQTHCFVFSTLEEEIVMSDS